MIHRGSLRHKLNKHYMELITVVCSIKKINTVYIKINLCAETVTETYSFQENLRGRLFPRSLRWRRNETIPFLQHTRTVGSFRASRRQHLLIFSNNTRLFPPRPPSLPLLLILLQIFANCQEQGVSRILPRFLQRVTDIQNPTFNPNTLYVLQSQSKKPT